MNITKLTKTCNTTRKVVKTMRIIMYVAIALFIIVTAVFFVPAFSEPLSSITVQDEITGSPIVYTNTDLAVKCSFAVVSLVLGSFIMLLCERVLKSVNTESTPFVAENVGRLKNMSKLFVCLSVIPSFVAQIVGLIFGSRMMYMDVELGKLAIALVVWCIALIFEYGVSLQEREDETL